MRHQENVHEGEVVHPISASEMLERFGEHSTALLLMTIDITGNFSFDVFNPRLGAFESYILVLEMEIH